MLGDRNRLQELIGRLAAEFVIVVVGVTIALWADGWVAQRSDRATEIARLVALEDNVTASITELRQARENAVGATDAMRRLLSLHEISQMDEESLGLLRFAFLYGAAFYPELNVYDDLKNSGELALLTNPELRRSLAIMDSRLELVRHAQDDLLSVQQLDIDPFAIDQLDLRQIYGSMFGQDVTAGELDPGIFSSMKFRNLILFKLDLVTEVVKSFESAETALQSVQIQIATQLASQRE
jgi:hypothetical protein